MPIRINTEEIPESVTDAKNWWRSQIRSALKETTSEYRSNASDAITLNVLAIFGELDSNINFKASEKMDTAVNIDTIMLYYPVGREVDTRNLIEKLIKAGKKVCLPLCTDVDEAGNRKGKISQMEARLIKSFDDLAPGAYNIPEPVDDTPVIAPDEIDLIVLPCLSCDTSCGRIGHGAGYYDNFLSKTRGDCINIAVCYDAILADVPLPREEHDRPVDAVITEEAVYTCSFTTNNL